MNPYSHWVLCRSLLYTKCYTSVTFLDRLPYIKFQSKLLKDLLRKLEESSHDGGS